jgi:hypothetical protein
MRNITRRLRVLGLAGLAVLLSGCLGAAARRDALAQRELVTTLMRERDSILTRTLAIEQRISELTATTDSLRRNGLRLEEVLRERDEQLRAARLELQRLKEIDLRSSRKPPR